MTSPHRWTRRRRLSHEDYHVGWLCAIPIELTAAKQMMDEEYETLDRDPIESNLYTLCRIGAHNVVIACLPQMGTNSAAAAVAQMRLTFKSIRFVLMVGIGGGVPGGGGGGGKADVRLGDVAVSEGVVQYDFGKTTEKGFKRTGSLNPPPPLLLNALAVVQANHNGNRSQFQSFLAAFNNLPNFSRESAGLDILFEATYDHVEGDTCDSCKRSKLIGRPFRGQPMVHRGTIASGNQVMKSGSERDKISSMLDGVLCFEMEAAGIMNILPCLAIRGICDYADSHKNKKWQPYASATAAAYGKEVLSVIPAEAMHGKDTRKDSLSAGNAFTPTRFLTESGFVNRQELLDEIYKKFSIASWVALVGIGGIGKTQLATQYAHNMSKDPERLVFWVHASSRARFEESFQDIADILQLPVRSGPKVDIMIAVKKWLDSRCLSPWTLIVDNADDLVEVASFAEFIPRNGTVLVTSRSEDCAFRLLKDYSGIIKIHPMQPYYAMSLLRNKLREEVSWDKGKALKLVKALDLMPLAISQAAAFINEKSPRYSISRYLTEVEGDGQLGGLLEQVSTARQRSSEEFRVSNSILLTWHKSFQSIRADRPSAARLISIMSFLDREEIPISLVESLNVHRRISTPRSMSTPWILNVIGITTGIIIFTLLQWQWQWKRTENHHDARQSNGVGPMLREVAIETIIVGVSVALVRKFLPLRSKFLPPLIQNLLQNLLQQVTMHSSDTEVKSIPATNSIEEDIICLRKYSFLSINSTADRLTMHRLVQWSVRKWLQKTGEFELLREESLLAMFEAFPDPAIVDWISSRVLLPHALSVLSLAPTSAELRPYVLALHLAIKCYEVATRSSSVNNIIDSASDEIEKLLQHKTPIVLTCTHRLAIMMYNEGRFRDGEAWARRAFLAREEVLGELHEDTFLSLNILALALLEEGKYEASQELSQRAVDQQRNKLGPAHPITLTSSMTLGLALSDRERYHEAKELYQQVVTARKAALGEEHPDTLVSMSQLALCLSALGRHGQAEEIQLHVLQAYKKVLGTEHLYTVNSMGCLAITYRAQKRWAEAEELHQILLACVKRMLGEDHPTTLNSLGALSFTYRLQRRWVEAEVLEVQVMKGRKKVLGLEHPETLTSMYNVSTTWKELKLDEDAEQLLQETLELQEKTLGKDHPQTKRSIQMLKNWHKK